MHLMLNLNINLEMGIAALNLFKKLNNNKDTRRWVKEIG